jgi:uncharacterized protein
MAKRVATRSCVGCGVFRLQDQLIRFIRSSRGTVVEDVYKNKAGRGAYLCKETKERCLIKAIAKHGFERALPIKNEYK